MTELTRSQVKNKRGQLRRRARAKQVPFAISSQHIRELMAEEKCPACEEPFSDERNHPKGRSIDRVVPANGYTNNNTTILCRNCNVHKSDRDVDGLVEHGKEELAEWLQVELDDRFVIMNHIQITDVQNNQAVIDYSPEFKEWFKRFNGLRRWSPKKFERWIVAAIEEGIDALEAQEDNNE